MAHATGTVASTCAARPRRLRRMVLTVGFVACVILLGGLAENRLPWPQYRFCKPLQVDKVASSEYAWSIDGYLDECCDMNRERNEGDQIAERLQVLLDAVIEAVERQSQAGGDDAITSDQLLAQAGPVQSAFVDLRDAMRDGTGVDLAIVEWAAKAGEPAFVSIHNGGEPTESWPAWRRVV